MKKIEKTEFYDKLIELITYANKSVKFYSVSCCFGFYSKGLKNFEAIYKILDEKLQRKIRSKPIDIRVLVKSDSDNPMDTYAMGRLAALEADYSQMKNDLRRDELFKQLWLTNNPDENVQFLIIDDQQIFVSEIQEEFLNPTLKLVLNVSESGLLYNKKEDIENFNLYNSMFDEKWKISEKLDYENPNISVSELKYHIEQYSLLGTEQNERDVQTHLSGYLKGKTGLPINAETIIGKSRIDLTIGFQKVSDRHGIEIKYKPSNNGVKEIIGQIDTYSKEFDQLYLVIALPKYDRERRNTLIKAAKEKNVIMIEVND